MEKNVNFAHELYIINGNDVTFLREMSLRDSLFTGDLFYYSNSGVEPDTFKIVRRLHAVDAKTDEHRILVYLEPINNSQ